MSEAFDEIVGACFHACPHSRSEHGWRPNRLLSSAQQVRAGVEARPYGAFAA